MLSIIIPSRSPQYLQQTIDDLLANAEGSVEIIVAMDGVWAPLRDDSRVTILHHGGVHQSKGMRATINAGVAISNGTHIMKIDEHCTVGQGYDIKLKADCEENWVVIPRRYRLDAETWSLIKDGRPPIDYMFIAYPYERKNDRTCGLHGDLWKRPERADILIDDTMSWQGSCWFMHRSYWDWLIVELDEVNYGKFTQEAQEIGMKVWLSGGRLVVNKKTWYAHWHKGKRGKGYGWSNKQYRAHMDGTERGRLYCIDYWMNNRWEQRVHDFEWLLEKFWPVPTWKDTWREDVIRDRGEEDPEIIAKGSLWINKFDKNVAIQAKRDAVKEK